MFWIIRIIISVFILTIITIISNKHLKKKLIRIFTLIMVFCLFYLSVLFPIENRIALFTSPQQIFEYAYQGSVEQVIYGENSCFVLYSHNISSVNSVIFAKEGNVYKLNPVNTGRVIYTLKKDGLSIDLYQVADTEEYYITIFGFSNMLPNDVSCLTDFQIVNTDNSFVACAFIEDINNYYFKIGKLVFDTAYINGNWEIRQSRDG